MDLTYLDDEGSQALFQQEVQKLLSGTITPLDASINPDNVETNSPIGQILVEVKRRRTLPH